MSHYRRAIVPGGTFFFTVVTRGRQPIFAAPDAVAALRAAFRKVRAERPFEVDAMVVLPDHLHCLWRLPEDDSDYSSRWREIKKATSRAIAPCADRHGERSVWQRRFWEHVIRDEDDWRRHVAYIHYNPVKHGWARRAADWPWSSFSRFVARAWHEPTWGELEPQEVHGLDFE
ncbi:MAG TPA: transposase [Rhodanobacteraceae bacterium]|nr:transposase [Rhodanobacteraceae bacterium]